MKKIYVPKAIFVLATVLSGLVNLLLSLIPLGLIMLAVRQPFTSSLAFLPVAMVLTTLFTLGVALLLAPICLMFADVVQIYQAILMAWLYLTPVMYPASMVPERYRGLVDVNPMSYFVEMFRAPIYDGVLPAARVVLVGSAFGVVSLLVGWVVFERSSDRIAYHL
jgi:ABC-type polysaccharide/polyol phosphate export permease